MKELTLLEHCETCKLAISKRVSPTLRCETPARDAADVIMRPSLPFFLLLVSACYVVAEEMPTRDTAETIIARRSCCSLGA